MCAWGVVMIEGLPQRDGGPPHSGVLTQSAGHRDPHCTRFDHFRNAIEFDPALGDHCDASGGGALDAGGSQGGPCTGLGEGGIDRGEMDVVGARAMGLNGLFRSVSGDTDEPARSEKRSSGPNVQRIETEVDALGPHCERDVNPAVDDDFDLRRIRPSHPADLCGKFKPVAAVERAVAKLDSVDAPSHVAREERVKPTV